MTDTNIGQKGRLRVGLNMNNSALVQKSGGTYAGLAIDIAERIGEATGVTLDFVEYPNARAVVDAAPEGWDIAFLAIDPSRTDRISFSQPYHSVEATFLIRDGLSTRSCSDVISGGPTILSAKGAAYQARLAGLSPVGTLTVAASPAEAQTRFRQGEGDALAGIRETLGAIDIAGCTVLTDHFAKIEQAVAMPVSGNDQMPRIDQILQDFLNNQNQPT